MNRVLAQKKAICDSKLWNELKMPSWIPESEKRQVEDIIPEFVDRVLLAQPIQAEISRLALLIDLPLKCHWVSPDASGLPEGASDTGRYLLKSDTCCFTS
jgi:hypothetical protein